MSAVGANDGQSMRPPDILELTRQSSLVPDAHIPETSLNVAPGSQDHQAALMNSHSVQLPPVDAQDRGMDQVQRSSAPIPPLRNMSGPAGRGGLNAHAGQEELRELYGRIITQAESFTVKKLQTTLRQLRRPVAGRKQDLQDRLFAIIEAFRGSSSDLRQILELLRLIDRDAPLDTLPRSLGNAASAPQTYEQRVNDINSSNWQIPSTVAAASSQHNHHSEINAINMNGDETVMNSGRSNTQRRRNGAPTGNPLRPSSSDASSSSVSMSFRASPFWIPVKQLHRPLIFWRPHPAHSQRTIAFRVMTADVNQNSMNSNTGMERRIYVLSQQIDANPKAGLRPLYYPWNCDIYVDHDRIGGNLRGVRGYVGSAKPADATEIVLKHGGTSKDHRLSVTLHVSSDGSRDDYTSGRNFAICMFIVDVPSLSFLINQVEKREHISVIQTQQRIVKSFGGGDDADDGLEMQEAVFPLKDPTLAARIRLPIRSSFCEHIEVFDAEAFLQLQQTAETWRCPVCNREITWESLAIDDYFVEVLQKAGPDATQIEVTRDGSWKFKDESDDDTDEDEDEALERAFKRPRRVEIIDLTGDDVADDNASTARAGSAGTAATTAAPSQSLSSVPASSAHRLRSNRVNPLNNTSHNASNESDALNGLSAEQLWDLQRQAEMERRIMVQRNSREQATRQAAERHVQSRRQLQPTLPALMNAFNTQRSLLFNGSQPQLPQQPQFIPGYPPRVPVPSIESQPAASPPTWPQRRQSPQMESDVIDLTQDDES